MSLISFSGITNALRSLLTIAFGPTVTSVPAVPRRVLLLNGAHIGDVVISTSLLPILKSAYPSADIGFVTGAWSQAVVANHPAVSYNHLVDHWRPNRSNLSLKRKVYRYIQTRRQALQEIRALKYDLAIHLHNGYPDLMGLSWRAGVPVRIAFTGSLWSPFASALAKYPSEKLFMHQGACEAELLRTLHISEDHLALRQSSLAPSTHAHFEEVANLIRASNFDGIPFSIVHIGSGAPFKELPTSFWREFVSSVPSNQPLLFTGRGDRESAQIQDVISGFDNCINACGRLSWGGFVAGMRRAEVLYGVDSMAGHVAAAVGTKSVMVYHGAGGVPRWRPESRKSTVWTNPTSCTPCMLPGGCKQMTCMSGIKPADLLSGI
jgi:heptosyltransferase-2